MFCTSSLGVPDASANMIAMFQVREEMDADPDFFTPYKASVTA